MMSWTVKAVMMTKLPLLTKKINLILKKSIENSPKKSAFNKDFRNQTINIIKKKTMLETVQVTFSKKNRI